MKQIQLPNQQTMMLPDDMPDQMIDALVQQYLGVAPDAAAGEPPAAAPVGGASPGAANVMSALLQAVGNHIANQDAAHAQNMQSMQDNKMADAQLSATDTAHKIMAMGEITDMLRQIGEMLMPIVPALNEIATQSQRSGDLVMAINNLSASVVETGKSIMSVMMMPAAISRDAEDKACMIGRVDSGQTKVM